jgi:two-component system, NarL family, invasion response regulator UvrY
MMNHMRVMIVDDHVVVRNGVRKIFEENQEDVIFGEAANGHEALLLVQTQEWDVVVLDISLAHQNGLEVLEEMKRLRPNLPVLIFSMHSEEPYIRRAFDSGAMGYVTKDSSSEDLVLGIKSVAAGERYLSRTVLENRLFDLEHS